jgi:hypothetical protein
VSFQRWLILACLFGPQFGTALVVSFYAGGAAVLAAALLILVVFLGS